MPCSLLLVFFVVEDSGSILPFLIVRLFIFAVNECTSGPCQNGATCRDDFDGYICACALGYSGGLCEIGTVVQLWNEFEIIIF